MMTLAINIPITRQVIGGGIHGSSASAHFEQARGTEAASSTGQAGGAPETQGPDLKGKPCFSGWGSPGLDVSNGFAAFIITQIQTPRFPS